jgi:putative heme-binding domain-containing protein
MGYKVGKVKLGYGPPSAPAACFVLALAAGADAQQFEQDHPGQYSLEAIATGSGVYSTLCAHCHGPRGDMVSGIDIRRGLFRRSSTDEDLARLITNGTAGGMPPSQLQPRELTGIVAYIRAGFDTTAAVSLGSATSGRALFEGKGACGTCHRVKGRGPRVAPDLSDVGIARAPAALQRSLVDPSSAMLPINRPVRIVTKDGQTIRGRRLNEDTHSVQLIDDHEQLRSIAKSDVRTFEVATTSPMPSFADRLTPAEIADVVAYLVTLREP